MKSAVFVFLYLVAALTLRAEIIVGASLEWLADSSASIGIYQVTESRNTSDSAFQLSFRLDDVLKSTPPQTAASSYSVRFHKEAPIVTIGNRFLIFLKPDETDSPRVAHLINLSTSQIGGLDSVSVNSKFELLTDQTQILATVRERIKSHPKGSPTKLHEHPNSSFDVEVPHGTGASRVLYAKSACFLLVPDDLKPAKPRLTKQDVVEVASRAAVGAGYRIAEYNEPQARFEFMRGLWTVSFGRKQPTPSEGYFQVRVDDKTGKSEVMPRE